MKLVITKRWKITKRGYEQVEFRFLVPREVRKGKLPKLAILRQPYK